MNLQHLPISIILDIFDLVLSDNNIRIAGYIAKRNVSNPADVRKNIKNLALVCKTLHNITLSKEFIIRNQYKISDIMLIKSVLYWKSTAHLSLYQVSILTRLLIRPKQRFGIFKIPPEISNRTFGYLMDDVRFNPNIAIRFAIEDQDSNKLFQIYSKFGDDVDPNFRCQNLRTTVSTPLQIAVHNKHLDLIHKLLEYDDLKVSTANNLLLNFAIWCGYHDIIRRVVSSELFKSNAKTPRFVDKSFLHACKKGDIITISLIRKYIMNPLCSKSSAIFNIVDNDNLDIMLELYNNYPAVKKLHSSVWDKLLYLYLNKTRISYGFVEFLMHRSTILTNSRTKKKILRNCPKHSNAMRFVLKSGYISLTNADISMLIEFSIKFENIDNIYMIKMTDNYQFELTEWMIKNILHMSNNERFQQIFKHPFFYTKDVISEIISTANGPPRKFLYRSKIGQLLYLLEQL